MTPKERECIQVLDDLVENATPSELKRIQNIDYQTQMDCRPFYEICLNFKYLISHQGNED